jgi:hypothetical protein
MIIYPVMPKADIRITGSMHVFETLVILAEDHQFRLFRVRQLVKRLNYIENIICTCDPLLGIIVNETYPFSFTHCK